ncbi:hypothetical protein CCR82_05290 [Halochromatium salexigens]|uniref:3-deoxy-manno-octulosonate cytidylyltransferase n=1 Tax=Halochromatium salexigens TaxID=49447 RepID=A0AAJ0XFA2_HALSE|nr:hypothetical protein [Halochromatium salexigens]
MLAIIQARLSSARLPGKVLRELAGQPMLGRVYSQLSRSHRLSQIIVATSDDPSDDAICDDCRAQAIAYDRGPLNHVANASSTVPFARGPMPSCASAPTARSSIPPSSIRSSHSTPRATPISPPTPSNAPSPRGSRSKSCAPQPSPTRSKRCKTLRTKSTSPATSTGTRISTASRTSPAMSHSARSSSRSIPKPISTPLPQSCNKRATRSPGAKPQHYG